MDVPVPPTDPRTSLDVPPLGTLPRVARIDEVTTRVVADNASPMTLDGTNTYVVTPPGSGVALVVDPGPDDADHLEAVQGVLAARDADPVAIVVTHRHADHAAAAHPWARHFGCVVRAADPTVAGHGTRGVLRDGARDVLRDGTRDVLRDGTRDVLRDGTRDVLRDGTRDVLRDGARLDLPGLRVDVVATPGHTDDHLSLRLGTGGLLTGDHLLGRGTTVVMHPDGDLASYLASLQRVLATRARALYPGHGPVMADDPEAVVHFHLAHREYRLAQVLAELTEWPTPVTDLVSSIYADHDEAVWPAAAASTRAGLVLLADRGQVAFDGTSARRLA